MDSPTQAEIWNHVWQYFVLHAQQRLTTFNFYIIVSTVAVSGYIASLREASARPASIIVGLFLPFFSFVFWKLDCRNRQLVKNAEDALRSLEKWHTCSGAEGQISELALFRRDDKAVGLARQRTSFWSWRNHYSYSDCFNLVFGVFAICGVLAALYSALRILLSLHRYC